MNLKDQLELCNYYYKKWKDLAISSNNLEEVKKFMKKAFFWLELQSAYLSLWAVENLKGNKPEVRRKIIIAKANLAKKLADYAKEILNEFKI